MKDNFVIRCVLLAAVYFSGSVTVYNQTSPGATLEGNLRIEGVISQKDDPVHKQDLVTKAYMDANLIKLGLQLGEEGIDYLINIGYTPKQLLENGASESDLLTKYYEGGNIVHFFPDSSGLVCKKDFTNVYSDTPWGCEGTLIGTLEEIGAGLTNSNSIISDCNFFTIAARRALSYSFEEFDDWYLPSKEELSRCASVLGYDGIAGDFTWSSSEVDADKAYALSNSFQFVARNKSESAGVIVVRNFD